MSRVKTELIEDIRRKTGVDPSGVIQYLYDHGTLDDSTVRQHVVPEEFMRRLSTSDDSERRIMEDIGEEYGLTRIRVLQLVNRIYPRT